MNENTTAAAFQLAVCGVLPEQEAILEKVRWCVTQLRACLGADTPLQLLTSPSYADGRWTALAGLEPEDAFCFCRRDEQPAPERCGHVLRQDTPLRTVLGEAMCDRADLVLAVWNEDLTEASGASWELIQLAHKEGAPCIWVSSKTGAVYWSRHSYFDPFDPARLKKLCDAYRRSIPEPLPGESRRDPLLALGAALRRRFLQKYRAHQPQTAPEQDRILQDELSLQEEGAGSESVRRAILERYRRFGDAAVTLNEQYQAIIYWRAILPFVASVFLAVGFYAETLLSVTGMPAAPRAMLAGTGFLIHGLLNLYVYFLSRSVSVRAKHQTFLQDRCFAEILRLLIHLVPYGIYTDLRVMCGGDERFRAAVQHLTLGGEPADQQLDGRSASLALGHIHELLADQISYHEASAARLRRVLDQLDRWYKVIFRLGFILVILRAFLQFYVCFFPLTGTLNGVELNSFVRSAANMIALMVPAWAAYFSSKTSLCSFRFNHDNHVRMAEELTGLLAQVDTLCAMGENVPVDVLGPLSEELVNSMIVNDTLAWERKFQSSVVTQL